MRTYFLRPGPSQNVQEKIAHSKEENSSIQSFTEVQDDKCTKKSGCSKLSQRTETCIIGRSDEISKYKSEKHLHRITVTNDKAAYHAVNEGKDLIWTNFTAFSHKLSSGSGQEKLTLCLPEIFKRKIIKKKCSTNWTGLSRSWLRSCQKKLWGSGYDLHDTGTEHLNAASFLELFDKQRFVISVQSCLTE